MKTFNETDFEQWLATQRSEVPCGLHPEVKRQLDLDGTRALCEANPHNTTWWRAQHFNCPVCQESEFQLKLKRSGVPEVNIGNTLDNWTPRNDEESQHLETVREFAEEIRKGFLLLLGAVGLGKTHLATAVLRYFFKRDIFAKGPLFIKQSGLLRELRATYSDKKAEDPIEKCKYASLLVLDEMGLSGGGRDEAPMLHEILDHRYGSKFPTVITSNLSWDELKAELGDRLSDRLKESAFAVLVFSGPSHRTECRDQYFKGECQRIELPTQKPF